MTVTHQIAAPEKTGKAPPDASTSSPAVRVLIVDDDPALRKILSVMLTHADFVCSTAACGEEALRLLENQPTDVVISDLCMPGISGMDLLIVVHERYPQLAFLMVTGEDETRVGVRAMQLGADDYLLKPFDADAVLGSLHRALQKKKLEREVQEYHLHLEEMVSERTQQLRTALQQTERSYEDTLELSARLLTCVIVPPRDIRVASFSTPWNSQNPSAAWNKKSEASPWEPGCTTLANSPFPTAFCSSPVHSRIRNGRSCAVTPESATNW